MIKDDIPRGTTFLQSLAIQRRVVWALVIREIFTRFGRHNIGFLWMFAEPSLFVLGISIVWILTGMEGFASNKAVAAFAVTSYSTVLLWRNPTGRMVKAIEANFSLLHHRNVTPMDFFLSRVILEYMAATGVFILIYIAFIACGIMHLPYNLLAMIAGWGAIAWFSFSFALMTAALSELSEVIEKFWHVVLYFMMPVSGSFFPLFIVPPGIRHILLFFPLIDATEYFHHGYYGHSMKTYYNLGYMCVFDFIFMLVSLSLVAIATRKVEITE